MNTDQTSKLLYISYDGISDPLGRSQILPYLLRIKAKGVKVYLLTFEKKERRKLIPYKELESSGIELTALAYHRKPPVISSFYGIIKGYLRACSIIRNEDLRVIHARGYVAGLIAKFLALRYRIPFIFDMRGFWADERAEAGLWKKNGLLFKAAKSVERMLLSSADEVIVLTDCAAGVLNSAAAYSSCRPKKASVISTCVDLDYFKPSNQAKQYSFIYTGSLSTWYLPKELMNFMRYAHTHNNSSRLLVVTQELAFMNRIIEDYPALKKSVTMVAAERDKMPRLIDSALAGLAFYKPGFSRSGCAPTKIGEYLACGLPVLVNSGIGDSDRIIGDNNVGVVLKDFDEQNFAIAIGRLEELLKEKDSLAARCRNVAKKYFCIDKGVESLLNIYRRIQYEKK